MERMERMERMENRSLYGVGPDGMEMKMGELDEAAGVVRLFCIPIGGVLRVEQKTAQVIAYREAARIQVMKFLRDLTGCGLRESKEITEHPRSSLKLPGYLFVPMPKVSVEALEKVPELLRGYVQEAENRAGVREGLLVAGSSEV